MQWPRFDLRPSLKRAWSFDGGGSVWRLIPTARGKILGEVRHHDTKLAFFFCLDEVSGRPLWHGRRFDEPWWIGVEAVTEDVAILHTYERPDMPQHRAMIAIDLGTGRELWNVAEAAFWFLSGTRVYGLCERLGVRTVWEIELRSGRCLRTFDESLPELGQLRRDASESLQTGEIVLPSPHAPGRDVEADRALERSISRMQDAAGLESLRLDDYLLVSYFAPRAAGRAMGTEFVNRFRVLDLRKGKTLHDEILARSVPAPVPDTFYVRDGKVVSVKDLTVVRAHRLPR